MQKKKYNIGQLRRHTSEMTDERAFFANETDNPLCYAFDKKPSVHPFVKGIPIENYKILNVWEDSLNKKAKPEKRAIYINIPFCETHCIFCGFYQNAFKKEEESNYIECLLKEMEMLSDKLFIVSHPFHAVYLGGGTPTALSAKGLFKLLTAINKYFPLSNDCEITVEGRIYHFDEEKILACIDAGANRFSLGVQSFNTFVRKKMGRIEEKERVIERLNYIKELNYAILVIDLIYGFPYQSMEIWEEDIKEFIDLEIDSADFYQLHIYKGKRLEKAVNEGKIAPFADIPNQALMYKKAVEMMKKERYLRLSMTHWARDHRERNIYNTLARCGSVCIPIGSGAGGWFNNYFFYQDNNLSSYYKRIKNNEKPISFCMRWPDYATMFREIIGSIETKGACNLRKISKKYKYDLEDIFLPILNQWEKVGLIRLNDGWLELTLAGEFWYVNITQALIDYFSLKYNFKE